MRLAPVEHIPPEALPAARHSLVLDATIASITGAFSGGVILVAFALALGANARQMGVLAAIPIVAQLAQLPATVLVERVRQRRKIGVLSVTLSRPRVSRCSTEVAFATRTALSQAHRKRSERLKRLASPRGWTARDHRNDYAIISDRTNRGPMESEARRERVPPAAA